MFELLLATVSLIILALVWESPAARTIMISGIVIAAFILVLGS